ncbi:MAG: hypothetical protein AAFW82_03190, partial [Pseudomonadota bacterium]
KGVKDLTYKDYVNMLSGNTLVNKSLAPTFTKDNRQLYITREVKATSEVGYTSRMLGRHK